jgi:hypothetical protein
VDQGLSAENLPRRHRITLPLVPSAHPGSLHLTGVDVARALEDEDLAP